MGLQFRKGLPDDRALRLVKSGALPLQNAPLQAAILPRVLCRADRRPSKDAPGTQYELKVVHKPDPQLSVLSRIASLSSGYYRAGMREDPSWTPLQRRIYRVLARPLLLLVLITFVGGVLLLWIGLREGWFFAEPRK